LAFDKKYDLCRAKIEKFHHQNLILNFR